MKYVIALIMLVSVICYSFDKVYEMHSTDEVYLVLANAGIGDSVLAKINTNKAYPTKGKNKKTGKVENKGQTIAWDYVHPTIENGSDVWFMQDPGTNYIFTATPISRRKIAMTEADKQTIKASQLTL